MNGFRQLQERLTNEGWYVAWALPCCQTCAWESLPGEHEQGPFTGQDIDFDRVLFNHEQDCEMECAFDTLPHYSPEQQTDSAFCFSGTPEGVENLKKILPIIEECGCSWSWNEKGHQRISISW